MKPISLTLYKAPHPLTRLLPWLTLSLWAGAIFFAFLTWQAWQTKAKREEAVRAQQAHQLLMQQEQARQLAERAKPKPYDQDARQILKLTEAPWAKVLDALERAKLPGTRVLSFQMHAGERVARIEIECATTESLHKYLELLVEIAPDIAWRLSEFKNGAGQDGNRVVSTIVVYW